jgi:hypothetical protein
MPKVSLAEKPATMKSLRLKNLVDEVLEQLPKPRTDDVIEDVFLSIEGNEIWKASYDRMVYESGKAAVIAWTGFWVSHAEQREGDQRQTAARSSLIESYSKLDVKTAKRGKKVKEAEALKAMHEHFIANRATLPPDTRDYREVILALIMDGIATDAAFARALEKPAYAW